MEYLRRFADREGRIYLERFWRKYHGLNRREIVETLLHGVRSTPKRVAMAIRAARPDDSFEEFDAALREHLPEAKLGPSMRQHLYDTYAPSRYGMADQGYIAGVHPLELWLVGYLAEQPDATLRQVFDASSEQRIAVYQWLFSRHRRAAQDRRIRSLLEIEAFLEVHRNWQQHGYPFESLVPSLATAIGSAADRPVALAELVGIIANDGVRQPTNRISELRFAGDTPVRDGAAPRGGRRHARHAARGGARAAHRDGRPWSSTARRCARTERSSRPTAGAPWSAARRARATTATRRSGRAASCSSHAS